MAPESSRAVVVPKFDMHIYTSELTSTELKDAINGYCIPLDLHPRLPHPGMTMNRLPSRYIVISMDTFLKLPTWTRTVVSKGDPLLEDQRPKPRVTPPLPVGAPIPALTPFQKNLEKPNPKIAAAREKKDQTELAYEDEPVGNRYVPNWGLRNDLRVCTFRACKELVSHLATPAEDEFFSVLSNAEVISRAYQTLGQSVVAQGELLKRHEQLNHDYVDLRNRNDVHLLELGHLRSSVRRTKQENEGLTNKLSLIESAHSGCESREKELTDVVKDLERERDEWRLTASNQVEQIRTLEKDLEPKACQLETAEERIRVLEDEKRALSAELARAEIDRQRLVREFIPTVVRRLHTSVEYRQALAAPVSLCYTAGWLGGISLGRSEEDIAGLLAGTEDLDIEGSKSWEAKHRELFTTQYPYVQKVADSYLLPMADLLRVSPDVPAPRPASEVPGSTREQVNDTDPKSPPPTHETTDDTPFGTTT
ncbi:hypothetical protein Tco_0458314 [Tanacetum coccineum]